MTMNLAKEIKASLNVAAVQVLGSEEADLAILKRSPLAFHSELSRRTVFLTEDEGAFRTMSRVDFAAMVRAWLKANRIKGVKVTTPRYSGAMNIEIVIPSFENESGLDYDAWQVTPQAAANRAALRHFVRLMNAAFPKMADRSDSRSDLFDARWTVRS